MSNKLLGIIALGGAPFLFIGFFVESTYPEFADSWFTGFWGLLYMIGWMASIVALKRIKAAGDTAFGKGILLAILSTLTIANMTNIFQIIAPTDKPGFFLIVDMEWPLSNTQMLVVGITVFKAKRLQGWQRYVPLAVGLWLPLTLVLMLIYGHSRPVSICSGIYSAIAWTFLAFVVAQCNEHKVAWQQDNNK